MASKQEKISATMTPSVVRKIEKFARDDKRNFSNALEALVVKAFEFMDEKRAVIREEEHFAAKQ